MNLKNLFWISPIAALLACAHFLRYEEDKIDQELVGEIWAEVAKKTNVDRDMGIPKIAFLERDFYSDLKKLHCKFLKEGAEQKCLSQREELFLIVRRKYGKPVESLYLAYSSFEWALAENCSQYSKERKKGCESDQEKIYGGKALARIFFGNSRIELYLEELENNFRSYQNFHNQWFHKEEQVFFYGTVAHELLHYAYWKNGIDSLEHHKLMKESKDLETILNLLSRRLEVKPDEIHKYLHLRSLELGIEGDEAEKRVRERKKEAEIRKNKIIEQK